MGMYDVFETDSDMEGEGVWIDYGDFRIKIASAGQGNKAYVRYAEKALKPVRKSMQAGALSNDRAQVIMATIYAKTIVKGWETKVDDEWVAGIEGRDGNLLTVNEENIKEAFTNLPNMFIDIQEMASSMENFRKAELEEEAGNS
tara:strand:+ start:212 stop:643 length:432 start_codon:yes stop_codon:yes gene_type:complete